MSSRHVLITGCSTGIGLACARRLAAPGEGGWGWTVHAGVRRDADARAIEDPARSLRPIVIDITDQSSIARAVDELADRTGESGLLALVNNAGISINGPIELLTPDDWRRQFDVNLFGQIEVTRACLPLIRRAVDHDPRAGAGEGGRIVMISSIAGTVAQPILGPYCATKHALNSVAGSLRLELRPQNIRVSIVAPGAIKSEIWRKAQDDAAQHDTAVPGFDRYAPIVNSIVNLARKAEETAIPADRVAAVVQRCLTARNPPLHIFVGRDAKFAVLARKWLPPRTMDALLARIIGIR